MHCRLCVLGGRKGRFSPLTSALRHYRRNACRSPRLPTPGRCQSVPNATSRIQLQLCDVKSPCASPSYLTDAHAAPNLGQIEKIDDTFDAVGLRAACCAIASVAAHNDAGRSTTNGSEHVAKRSDQRWLLPLDDIGRLTDVACHPRGPLTHVAPSRNLAIPLRRGQGATHH